MFVTILTFKCPIELIQQHHAAHKRFLDEYYAKGLFIASGPQVPREGGIIILRAKDKNEVRDIMQQDPFYQHDLADYRVLEFEMTSCHAVMEQFKTLAE